MKVQRLQTRFLLAGCLLVTTTVVSGLWSALTFIHLGRVVNLTLDESQETIDLASVLANTLERADDALLLSLTGDEDRARGELAAQRQRFEEAYTRLRSIFRDANFAPSSNAMRTSPPSRRPVSFPSAIDPPPFFCICRTAELSILSTSIGAGTFPGRVPSTARTAGNGRL